MQENLKELVLGLKDELRIFRSLDDEELKKLAPYFERKHVPAKTLFFNEGDPGDFIGLIISGSLEVKKRTEFEGKQIVIAVLSKGSSIGELSVSDGKTRSATVVAIEDSDLLVMKRKTLNEFMNKHPDIGIKILKEINRTLSIRLRLAVDRITALF